ncbi:MAG TPA: hypothetical protein VHS78_14620 [Candidatus Elarobacter sp.]|nr:hypothetical protein [Candidatus Elarobacter sp.]
MAGAEVVDVVGIALGIALGCALLDGAVLVDGIGEDDCANATPVDASASAVAASISRLGWCMSFVAPVWLSD